MQPSPIAMSSPYERVVLPAWRRPAVLRSRPLGRLRARWRTRVPAQEGQQRGRPLRPGVLCRAEHRHSGLFEAPCAPVQTHHTKTDSLWETLRPRKHHERARTVALTRGGAGARAALAGPA